MVLDMLVAGGASAVSQIATFCQFVCTTALSAQAIRQSANVPVLCPALHGGCDDNRWLTCTDFNVFLPVESLCSEADKPTVVDTHQGLAVLARIGEGAFARVSLATYYNNPVVIKAVKHIDEASALYTEASISKTSEHENIVRMHLMLGASVSQLRRELASWIANPTSTQSRTRKGRTTSPKHTHSSRLT